MQGTELRYAIKFVANMDKAIKFHRDVLGLKLKFESPGWSEFLTGETTLALHPASDKNPAGKVELGFTVPDVETFSTGICWARACCSACRQRSRISAGCSRSLSIPRVHIAAWALRRHSSRSRELLHQARCCMRRIEPIVSYIENGIGIGKEIRMESTISTKNLKAKLDRKESITVVETLAPERYREAHLPGALNIPPERIKELAPQLLPNKDAEIVTYCTNTH